VDGGGPGDAAPGDLDRSGVALGHRQHDHRLRSGLTQWPQRGERGREQAAEDLMVAAVADERQVAEAGEVGADGIFVHAGEEGRAAHPQPVGQDDR
jgi:hypothetical protein